MQKRFSTLTIVAWSLSCLAGGVVGGAILGFELAGRAFDHLSRPLMTGAGVQALNVVWLLDHHEEGKARWLLESEIDSTIQTLSDERNRDNPLEAALYQRLVSYRKDHPDARRAPDLPDVSR
jgi:hypothetical protein